MFHTLWTTPYFTTNYILLTASLPFLQHHGVLHTSCTPTRRPSICSLDMTIKLFITRCNQNWYIPGLLKVSIKWSRNETALHSLLTSTKQKPVPRPLFKNHILLHQLPSVPRFSILVSNYSTRLCSSVRLHCSHFSHLWRLCISSHATDKPYTIGSSISAVR